MDFDETETVKEEFHTEINMKSKLYQSLCIELKLFDKCEKLIISGSENYVDFVGDKNGISKGKIKYKHDEEQLKITTENKFYNEYPINYINKFNNISHIIDSVLLSISLNGLLKIEFKDDKIGIFRYYIAPKLD